VRLRRSALALVLLSVWAPVVGQDLAAGDKLPAAAMGYALSAYSDGEPTTFGQLVGGQVAIVHFFGPYEKQGLTQADILAGLSGLGDVAAEIEPLRLLLVLPHKQARDQSTRLEEKGWFGGCNDWVTIRESAYFEPVEAQPPLYAAFRPGDYGGRKRQIAIPATYVLGPDQQVLLAREGGDQAALADLVRGVLRPDGEGSISVTSAPEGHIVDLDDHERGQTPASLNGVPAGYHRVALKVEGKLLDPRWVLVKPGEHVAVAIDAAGAPRPPGPEVAPGRSGLVCTVSDLDDCEYFIDNEYKQRKSEVGPMTVRDVRPGEHTVRIRFEIDGKRVQVKRMVTLEPDRVATIDVRALEELSTLDITTDLDINHVYVGEDRWTLVDIVQGKGALDPVGSGEQPIEVEYQNAMVRVPVTIEAHKPASVELLRKELFGDITVTVDLDEARVLLDDAALEVGAGRTSQTVLVAPGDHRLEYRLGEDVIDQRTVAVGAGETATADFSSKQYLGELSITAKTADGTLTVDGKQHEFSPSEPLVLRVRPGAYEVALRSARIDEKHQVTVEAGKEAKVVFKTTGLVVLVDPDVGSVSIKGPDTDETLEPQGGKIELNGIEPGRYTITARKAGKLSAVETLDVRDGETPEIKLGEGPRNVRVEFESTPPGLRVFVTRPGSPEREEVGRTPCAAEYPEGNYRAVARDENGVFGDEQNFAAKRPGPIVVVLKGTTDPNMVLIPAGTFVMGYDGGRPDQRPTRRVRLAAYYIDAYPVTNADYAPFAEETGRPAPVGEADAPVVNVTWDDAKAYAEWCGKRLPTEAEWERAARGLDNYYYPWGPDFNAANCNCLPPGAERDKRKKRDDDEGEDAAAEATRIEIVGARDGNRSSFGVYDMAGNVWQWVQDWYSTYQGRENPLGPTEGKERVIRGGAYDSTPEECMSIARGRANPTAKASNIGFRCALTARIDEGE